MEEDKVQSEMDGGVSQRQDGNEPTNELDGWLCLRS
jgi:hypothetical protein